MKGNWLEGRGKGSSHYEDREEEEQEANWKKERLKAETQGQLDRPIT